MKQSLYKICTQATILGLLLSTACTHKRDSLMGDTELNMGNEAAIGETTESTTDVASTESVPTENTEAAPPAEDLALTSSADAPGAPSEELSAPVEATTAAESNDLSTLSGELAAPVPSETTEATLPSGDSLSGDSLSGGEMADNQPELVIPSTESTQITTPEVTSPLPDAAVASNPDTLPAPAAEPTVEKPVVASKLPSVPTSAVKKGKHSLNRYYFLRNGDTAESLSQLFYGNKEQAKEIISWNGNPKAWKVGSTILFVSADQPDDTEMSSFYEEQGISTDTYTVKAGDQLSTIAQNKYGSVMSWKEIASLNHLQNPDHIKPGQTLTILPSQMTSIHEKPAAVTAQLPPAVAPKSAEPEVKVLTEEDQEEMAFGGEKGPVEEKLAGQNSPNSGSQMEKSKETHMAALEVAQPESSNFTALALGGGFALLALFLFMVKRSRSRARAEFME